MDDTFAPLGIWVQVDGPARLGVTEPCLGKFTDHPFWDTLRGGNQLLQTLVVRSFGDDGPVEQGVSAFRETLQRGTLLRRSPVLLIEVG